MGTVFVHMSAKSVITTIAVVTPILSFTQGSVLPVIVAVVLIVTIVSQGHFNLPFYNAVFMVGTEIRYPYDYGVLPI